FFLVSLLGAGPGKNRIAYDSGVRSTFSSPPSTTMSPHAQRQQAQIAATIITKAKACVAPAKKS
ncbi:unnamed protein product, partial [Amoebophrya sp. A25]